MPSEQSLTDRSSTSFAAAPGAADAAALREERDRLARLALAVPCAIHTLRRAPDGTLSFPYGHERVAELYGLPADELRRNAKAINPVVHADDAQRVREAVRVSAATMQPWHCEFRIRHAQRGERWIEGRSMPVRDADGSLLWHGALTDITERKRSEQALFASRAQLQTVFAALSEGLVLCSLDGLLFEWNPAALRMHGFTSLEEAQRPLDAFRRTFELRDGAGREMPIAEWPMARVLRGEAFEHQVVHIRQRELGWTKVFDYGGALVHDADGRAIVALVHLADITERHRHQAEVLRLNAELEQRVAQRTAALQAAVKELEAFSYSVSHDLRAPLRAIDGFSQALLQDCAALLPPDGQRFLGIIRDSAGRMGQLIDDLLAFSRVGRAPLQRHRIDAALLVRDAMAQLAPQIGSRRIELQVGELPPCEGDLSMLRQVWINLLSNAVKYSRQRDPAQIEVGCLNGGDAPATYFVRDNGAGFDMRYVHKLFGVFERLHRADEFEGTGVGLAIVQRIVQRHGGQVRAEGEPGRGATFYFHLGARSSDEPA